MDFMKQHRLNQWLSNISLMHVLVAGLLLSNLLVGGLAWYGTLHQKVEVTPFSGTSGYQNSTLSVDTHYLSMMTENFMYSRFNVTPDTVRASHQRLLPFIDEREYPKISDILNKEARAVT
ncbi:MAG: TraE/TraK family type IV conjugative transfer system protein, partial [Legionellaceae bacterium]|nr:TraE/TraK family type IV conjugative transfer system protein [Legionellaceae bacterium]